MEHRLDGLLDAPRPGSPRSIDDARVDAVITRTLESIPEGATHWSTRTVAREMALLQTAVTRILRAFGLQPHRQETFKLSSDPLFVEKVRDGPVPGPAPEGHGAVRGREEPDLGAGSHATRIAVGPGHCRVPEFLRTVEANVPGGLNVHLVIDNYGTHKTPTIRNWFARHPRFHVHFTPTSASWLNQVERWFATLTEKYVRRGTHRSTRQIEQAIKQHLLLNNANPKPFHWSKSADDILASIERFCLRTSNSGH